MRFYKLIFVLFVLFLLPMEGISAGLAFGTVTDVNGDEITGAVITLVLEEVWCEAGCGEGDCGGGCEQGDCGRGDCRGGCGGGDCGGGGGDDGCGGREPDGDDPDDDAPGVTETDDVGNYEFSDYKKWSFYHPR